MQQIQIRPATADDTSLILGFIRELAGYEKALAEVTATEVDLRKTLFGPDPRAYALICSLDGATAGFALYFFNYSTWLGKLGLFLEDLYISPEYRGKGAGKALLQYLAKVARQHDCGRMEWNVLDWNEPAIRFYDSLDAIPQSEWTGYRLSARALRELAEK